MAITCIVQRGAKEIACELFDQNIDRVETWAGTSTAGKSEERYPGRIGIVLYLGNRYTHCRIPSYVALEKPDDVFADNLNPCPCRLVLSDPILVKHQIGILKGSKRIVYTYHGMVRSYTDAELLMNAMLDGRL
jgi:hypothetical protein